MDTTRPIDPRREDGPDDDTDVAVGADATGSPRAHPADRRTDPPA